MYSLEWLKGGELMFCFPDGARAQD